MAMLMRVLAIVTVLLLLVPAVQAVQPDEVLSDPALEARARGLSAQLRCLVCQNQSIDDSNAPLARDLRVLVRERLVAGDSDDAVRSFVVERYGSFVLLKPPFDSRTLILWFAPFLILLGASLMILRHMRRPRASPDPSDGSLSRDEEVRLAELLTERDGDCARSDEALVRKRRDA